MSDIKVSRKLVDKIKREVFTDKETKENSQGNTSIDNPEINPELLKMFPPERMEKIKRRELRRYKQAQEKKWKNWMESVSK